MKQMIEKRVFLTVEADRDQTGRVQVTVMSSFVAEIQLVGAVIFSVLSCGLLALLFAPLFCLKYNRWNQSVAKAVALLKADLGG